MKRRSFGLLASSGVIALQVGARAAGAQSATPDASLLGTTLTPFGAEKAGNADGSIPAWTGGATELPAGVAANAFVPDLFPDEKTILVIDSSNVTAHADMLSEGTVVMINKYPGFKVMVYPTHRTAAAPQWVYDRVKANVATAKFTANDPVSGRYGFEGAFAGIPFPIPDQSNPNAAGAQIIWNYNAVWAGKAIFKKQQGWSVSNGQLSMAFAGNLTERYPYYMAQSLDEFENKYGGLLLQQSDPYYGPPNLVGQNIVVWGFTQPYKQPQEVWELLNGQGRVRRAPEVAFDTPAASANGIAGYDEYYGFNGSIERYDWKLIGKREMYIPYNNNALYAVSPQQALLAHFVQPDLVRWEKHRCWVVEATLHPGERNVLAKRTFYFDEDTWTPGVVDAWDGNGELFKVNYIYNRVEPSLPGVVYGNNAIHNLQTDDYVTVQGSWNRDPFTYLETVPSSLYDPINMAASAQY